MQLNVKDQIIHGTVDYIIVHSDSRYETELTITGENGKALNLEIDGELEEKKYRCWGTVVAIPQRITPDKVMFSEDGKPVRMSEIQMDVNVGEKLYFEYLALQDGSDLGENHYAVPYSMAIATIREGQIVPVGSHVLLKPVYPEDCVEIEKGIYGRQNSFGLVTEMNVPPKKFEATVSHVGLPLKGRDVEVEPGMHVGIDRFHYGHKYTIQGEEYLVCRQKDISFIFNPV